MSARFIVADVFDGLATLEDGSVDVVISSPPFLALRSYLPADHPDKGKEIGSEATPAEFLDVLLRVTAELRRVLAPHGSICIELGDTYAGSGGAGGDYDPGGWREGQEKFEGSAYRVLDRKHELVQKGGHAKPIRNLHGKKQWGGDGWPLAKSKTLIPELYRIALAYGINPLTGQESPAGRWRVRNVVTWCRPNPAVGFLGDKWRPATSDIVVACTSDKRYWDEIATRYPAGAPLLDYWEIPPGGYNGKTLTIHREPCGPHDGGERTTSPDCPVHGDRPGLPPTVSDGERAGTSRTRTPRTDTRHAPTLPLDCEPTDANPDHSDSSPSPTSESSDPSHVPAAKRRSKASSKTAPAPGTTSADTPSVQTADCTVDKPASPESDEQRPDNPESNTSAADSADSPTTQSPDRTADSGIEPEWSEACSCSWSKVVKEEYTSHYAVYPPALVEPLIKAMAPPKVCQTCGEPSRRIVETTNAVGRAVNHSAHRPDMANRLANGEAMADKKRDAPEVSEKVTLGWTDCGHNTWRPALVLDPFAGSGTTLAVATGHGHDAIGIDLDERNYHLALERVGPMLLGPPEHVEGHLR